MKWCCTIFHGWFGEAGKRGLAVFVATRGHAEPAFILQFRALDPGGREPHTDAPLSLVSQIHIHFCPWCGADLKERYRDTIRELDKSELQVPL
jgi:hypothetical protein